MSVENLRLLCDSLKKGEHKSIGTNSTEKSRGPPPPPRASVAIILRVVPNTTNTSNTASSSSDSLNNSTLNSPTLNSPNGDSGYGSQILLNSNNNGDGKANQKGSSGGNGNTLNQSKSQQNGHSRIASLKSSVAQYPPTPDSVDEYFSCEWVKGGVVEIGYIQRVVNPRDRWSGQIAFPGGKQNLGEADEETAKREVLEEIGVDLNSGFALLGRLDDREIRTFSGDLLMILSTFVYLQMSPNSPITHIHTREVAHFFFVPVTHFQNHLVSSSWHPVTRDPRAVLPPVLRWMPFLGLLGLGKIHFAGVILPETGLPHDPRLWGLTLEVTGDLLLAMGFDKSKRIDRPLVKLPHLDLDLWLRFWWSIFGESNFRLSLPLTYVCGNLARFGAAFFLYRHFFSRH